ncbi:MAG: hypothetical protein GY838_02905 [bacterium]|nr:hypothetical protein [bacterium]
MDFPVRHFLRCREDLFSGVVHVALLAAFLGVLVAFGRTLAAFFSSHGDQVDGWLRFGAWTLLVLFCLSVLRRLYYKVAELRALRREMRELKATFRHGEIPPES